MRIVIVDKDDNIIGSRERDELLPSDIYRVSALWLTNSKGEILIAQRAFTKKKDPGNWGPAAAGTLEEGEDYDSNIVKEIAEELGLSVALEDLKRRPKMLLHGRGNDYFTQWYFLCLDKPAEEFIIQKDEVAQVKWYSADKLQKEFAEHPEKFLYAMPQYLPIFLGQSN